MQNDLRSRIVRSYLILSVGLTCAVTAIPSGSQVLLVLSDEGSFFINGVHKDTVYANRGPALTTPERITIRSMYVRYWKPAKPRRMPPVIMVHGAADTGSMFETTPDGREGWATYFLRKGGADVYVIDHVGRGRSGFDNSIINEARVKMDASLLPGINRETDTARWTRINRIGPALGTPYTAADGPWFANTQFPVEAADEYYMQLVPSGEVTLVPLNVMFNSGLQLTPPALVQLIERIGPAIVVASGQGGTFGVELARLLAMKNESGLLKALIDIEGGCVATDFNSEVIAAMRPIPYLAVEGDFLLPPRRCQSVVDTINANGGEATYLWLPQAGVHGNSSLVMIDRNNLQIADLLLGWLHELGLAQLFGDN